MVLAIVLACAMPDESAPDGLPDASRTLRPSLPALRNPEVLRWPEPMLALHVDVATGETCLQEWWDEAGTTESVTWSFAADGLPVTRVESSGAGIRWTRGRDERGVVRLVYIHDHGSSWRDRSRRAEEVYDAAGRIVSSVGGDYRTWTWDAQGRLVAHSEADGEPDYGYGRHELWWDAEGRFRGYEYEGQGSRWEIRHQFDGARYVGYDSRGSEHRYTFDWLEWDAQGLPTYGEGVANEHGTDEPWTERREWDERGRLRSYEVSGDGTPETLLAWDGDDLVAMGYDRDQDGQIDDVQWTWAWDERGRVTREEWPRGERSWRWSAEGSLERYEGPRSDGRFSAVTFSGSCPDWLWSGGTYQPRVPSERWLPPQPPDFDGPVLGTGD